MGFYGGYPGMNSPISYNYYNDFVNSGLVPSQAGQMPAAPGQANTAAHGQPQAKKSGFGAFFSGVKNGFANMVKSFFTIPGFLLTAASVAGVAFLGAGMLLPLIALGVGVGGYQLIKGAINGDAEKMGEGVFTLGATLLAGKLTPNKVGPHELADTSLLGKLKAPFIGKGAFKDPDVTYWQALRNETDTALANIKGKFFAKAKPAVPDKPVPLTAENLKTHTESSASEHSGGPGSQSSVDSWHTAREIQSERGLELTKSPTAGPVSVPDSPPTPPVQPESACGRKQLSLQSMTSDVTDETASVSSFKSLPAEATPAKPTMRERLFGRREQAAKPTANMDETAEVETVKTPGFLKTRWNYWTREYPGLKETQNWFRGKSTTSDSGAAGSGTDWSQLSASDRFQKMTKLVKEANMGSSAVFGATPYTSGSKNPA